MSTTNWRRVRLSAVTSERRKAVVPGELADEVFHYSIPVWDEVGDGCLEPSEGIGSAKLLLIGDEVLVSKLNPRKSRVIEVESHEVPTVASTEFVGLRPSAGLNRRFLAYLFLTETMRQALDAQVQSVTRSQQRVNPAAISKAWVDLPPVEEQRRIADHLDAETARIDALIAKRQRQIELLGERTRSTIETSAAGRWLTRADGVPVGIEAQPSVRLGAVARVQSGLTLDASRKGEATSAEFPYLRVANVHDGSLDLSDLKSVEVPSRLAERCALRAGDVLMTEGGDPDKLGRGAVWREQVSPCLHQNHVFAVRPDRTKLVPEYLALITRTPYARAYFEMTAVKSTGIASTSAMKINSFRVPLPEVAEQWSIVEAYQRSSGRIESARLSLERQIELLRERRQALITAMVTGMASPP